MVKNGKKKTSATSGSNKNRVSVEIKDVKFEGPSELKASSSTSISGSTPTTGAALSVTPSNSIETLSSRDFDVQETKKISNLAASKLEKILSELEQGYLSGGAINFDSTPSDSVGNLRKKMAALGFQAGIQLSGGGAFRDARRLLDGFPGDDEYELTFEDIESDEEEEEDEDELGNEEKLVAINKKIQSSPAHQNIHGAKIRKVNLSEESSELDDLEDEDDFDSEDDLELLNNEDILLERLDPLRVLNKSVRTAASTTGNTLNYPLIDPLKLQVIQSAESELTTVHDLFESTSISANQKLPLLKRKYMELMQQDIRHRLEALRVRDYLDTLHLERQVVERELEKAINLRASMEQLCEQLQLENSKIRAEKAGITAKLYSDLELKAFEEELTADSGNSSSTGSSKKKSNGKKSQGKKGTQPGNSGLPVGLPDSLKSISFEVPDANKLLEGAQGDLRSRFQLLINLYNQREAHFLAVLKAKDTEIQLLQGHFFSHQTQLHKANQSNRELVNRVNDLSSSESDLRSQLSVYVDKFKQVEDTLSKSNDLFATFRHEMEQMTAKLSKLEKENQNLQSKCTTLSRNIIEMADERSKQAAAMELLRNQKGKLENLCRSMQAERNAAFKNTSASLNANINDDTNATFTNSNTTFTNSNATCTNTNA